MKLKLLLTLILMATTFTIATPSLAAPTNAFQFTSVSPTSCAPGASVMMNFLFSVAPNEDPRTDNWTLTNFNAGTTTARSVTITSSGSGIPTTSGTFNMQIPASTKSNDIIIITVSMVSKIGQNATNTSAFDCTTGAIVPVPTASGCIFTDGRINCRAEDAAQTAAIYCTGDGVTIFAVNNSVGKFAFTATKDEIAKVPANPDKNTLIKQVQNIALYRLHGGKMQVNAPHDYVYIWDGC